MGVTITRPVRRRPEFHKLRVARLERLTDDAYEVAFEVPAELRRAFAFRAGQHVTVRRIAADGTDVRRSYSLCSTPDELALRGELRIGVKVLPGGAFSSFVDTELAAGDLVEVLPPLGHFSTDFAAGRRRHYAAVVAGSGITPVLSLLATGLAAEPDSRFTVLYGNRYARSVMFAEQLADLKDRYPARLHLVHVLSREPGDAELLSGRLDPPRLRGLLGALLPPSTVDEWFLCGPYGVVTGAQQLLAELGVAPEAVHAELFHVADPPTPASAPVAGPAGETSEVTIRLDGRSTTFTMGRGERVLDRAREVRGEVPYSCRGGVCSTCRARILDGQVRMARNYALEPDELAAGYVLTCQSSPVTDRVTVDYDG
jgi:ring-1,2-phenylacetyl-CoA epoxidase subunit PaaE